MTKVKITETTPVCSAEEQMKLTNIKQGMIFKFTRHLVDGSSKPETFILAVVHLNYRAGNLKLISIESFNRFSDSEFNCNTSIWEAIEGYSDYTYSDFVVYSEVEIKLS